MEPQILINLASSLTGAVFLEVLHWREIYVSQESRKYRKQIRSVGYWLLAASFIVTSGIGAFLWNYGSQSTPRDYLITGAGFGPIVKTLLRSFGQGKGKGKGLGVEGAESETVLSAYLGR